MIEDKIRSSVSIYFFFDLYIFLNDVLYRFYNKVGSVLLPASSSLINSFFYLFFLYSSSYYINCLFSSYNFFCLDYIFSR